MDKPKLTLLLTAGSALALSGCGHHSTTLHSVQAVKDAFAARGVRLVALDPTRVSTMLFPAPALPGTRPKRPYFVVVITDRDWMRDIDRHRREAASVLGQRRADWATFSTRRDNVFLAYPAGPPKAIARLKAALDDVE